MTRFLVKLDLHVKLVFLLYFFFSMFWGINGLDKFANGEMRHDTNPSIAKFAVLDAETGELEYRIHKYRIHGWFGVNRDAAFGAYFEQLGISYEISQVILYGFAAVEVLLGIIFLYIFIRSILNIKAEYTRSTLFGTRTLHRLTFKVSTLIFVFFCFGDSMFGDRMELWEHATFLLLLLISYFLFLQADKIEKAEHDQVMRAYQGERNRRKERDPNFSGADRRAPREKHIDHAHH